MKPPRALVSRVAAMEPTPAAGGCVGPPMPTGAALVKYVDELYEVALEVRALNAHLVTAAADDHLSALARLRELVRECGPDGTES